MPFPLARAPSDLPLFSVIGKLPRRADFVRIHATHPATLQLDQLISDSLSRITSNPALLDQYRQAGPSLFLLRLREGGGLFFGGLRPSNDEVGRHYPLVAGALAYAEAPLPLGEWLLAREVFFEGLKDELNMAFEASAELYACRAFLERYAESAAPLVEETDPDLHLARQLLEKALDRTPATAFDALLKQDASGNLESVVLSFIFYKQFLRKYGTSLPSQAYRLPLSSAKGEGTLTAAMWLSLYAAATAGVDAPSDQCLVTGPKSSRTLWLLPDRITDPHLAPCWGVPMDAHAVVDVRDEAAPWRRHQLYAEAAYVLGRRLVDPALTLAQLRDVVRDLALNIN